LTAAVPALETFKPLTVGFRVGQGVLKETDSQFGHSEFRLSTPSVHSIHFMLFKFALHSARHFDTRTTTLRAVNK
jgi:hypothetical protein